MDSDQLVKVNPVQKKRVISDTFLWEMCIANDPLIRLPKPTPPRPYC